MGAFTPKLQKLLRLQNGYYLLYYHRQQTYTMGLLYARFLVPLAFWAFMIKKNPFYTTYPIMFPLSFIGFFMTVFFTVRYSRRTNHMVHQILIDATGSELIFVYKNQALRRFRSDQTEVTMMVSNLMNPPQGPEYRPLLGQLFPQQFPFNYRNIFDHRYFWNKYWLTQRNCFSIAKRPHYVNYEILCNACATRVTDFSQVDIFELQNDEMTREELERVLLSQNEFTEEKFVVRMLQMKALDEFERKLEMKQQQLQDQERVVSDRQALSFEDVLTPKQLKQTDNNKTLENSDDGESVDSPVNREQFNFIDSEIRKQALKPRK